MAALAHLPDPLITLPFRIGKEDTPDWTLCLKYISLHHSSNNTSSVEAAFKQMNALHKIIVQTCRPDTKTPPCENFIEHTLIPYCQLVTMAQAHLPLHGAQVHKKVFFIWRDSFNECNKNESYNSNLELLCCVYNIAASWVYVAVQSARRRAIEDVKNAFKGFQNAAGYYEMAEQLLVRLPSEHVKGDLAPDSLKLLQRICLVMAHHCAYLKAAHDMGGNHAMLSKIAREGGKQYEEVAAVTRESTWYNSNKKNSAVAHIEPMLTIMSIVFDARSHLHLAAEQAEANEWGTVIAHFQKAQSYLAKLPKMQNNEQLQWINSIINTVNKEHDKAIASNESVYFMRIPRELPTPSGLPRPLGKATEHPSFIKFESKRDEDPFFGIIPAHIAMTAAKWRETQRNLVSVCNKSCTENHKKMEERFRLLGVTTIIELLSGEKRTFARIPVPLREKIEFIHKDESGNDVKVVSSLLDLKKTCDGLCSSINLKIQEIEAELEADRKEDEAYLTAYGERMWRSMHQPSSEVGEYKCITGALQEHRKGLQEWLVEPYTKVTALMDTNLRDLARLDWPTSELDALMPFVDPKDVYQREKKVLDQVEELKRLVQRKQVIDQIQETRLQELNILIESDNVTFALSAVESDQRDAVLESAAQKISDAIEEVNQTVREEREIITGIEEVVNSIGIAQSSDPIIEGMHKVCNALEMACSLYTSLRQELGELVRYASSALDRLEALLSSAKSFAVCRKLEAEGLRESIDAQIARKIAEMQHGQSSMDAIEESRRRQAELQNQMAFIQQQQQPQRTERMAEIMRRQREMAATFTEASPPFAPTDASAPPSYESVMNTAYYGTAPPPPPPYK